MGLLPGGISELPLQGLVLTSITSLFLVAVALNILKQLLFRNRYEPPVVFHWIPFVGSAIVYGQDPVKFLKNNQAKVGALLVMVSVVTKLWLNAFCWSSMGIFLHLSCSGERSHHTWESKGIISY